MATGLDQRQKNVDFDCPVSCELTGLRANRELKSGVSPAAHRTTWIGSRSLTQLRVPGLRATRYQIYRITELRKA